MSFRNVAPVAVAFAVAAVVIAVVPVVAYGAGIAYSVAVSGDMGGPLNFVLIPAGGAVVGCAAASLFAAYAAVFRRYPFVRLALPVLVGVVVCVLSWSYLTPRASSQFAFIATAGVTAWLTIGATAFIGTLEMTSRVLRQHRG